jgi:hypothetical protein
MKNTIIAFLISIGMSLLYLTFYGLITIPEFYEAFCRFFGVVGTVCSPQEALVRAALFFAMCFTLFRVGLIIDTVLDELKKKEKGGE